MKTKTEKTNGSFAKVTKLVTVLRKCNGKAVIGDSSALLSPKASRILVFCGLAVLVGALFCGAFFLQPYAGWLLTGKDLSQILMLLLLITSFVLAIKDIVTVLYTSDDLELLLPMPFSDVEIVLAKLAVAAVFPVTLSIVILNSVCLGYGIREGAGVPFIVGTVLSSILIPVTGIFTAALLVVIIFRVFGIIRNRDITVALGGIFTFGLTFAYIYLSNRFSGEGAGEATAALNRFSSVSRVFPNISFMSSFMFEGSISGLLISLVFTIILIVLALLAIKAFYFNTALSMQNTAAGHKTVSKELLGSGKKSSVLKALTGYEAKSARRNPAYMIYGFAMSFFWPVLFGISLFMGSKSLLSGITRPLGPIPALLSCVSFGITASCFSCGFNILPGSAFSREGSNFFVMRSLPVDFTVYYKSKRNFSLLICSLGSVLYVIVFGIAGIAAGYIPAGSSWTILAGACVSFFLDVIFIDLMLLKNSKKPRFNWDSETELSRKLSGINLIAIIIGTIVLIVCLLILSFAPMLNAAIIPGKAGIVVAAALVCIFVLALAVDRYAVQKAAQNLMKPE